jgi:hypothetical protein
VIVGSIQSSSEGYPRGAPKSGPIRVASYVACLPRLRGRRTMIVHIVNNSSDFCAHLLQQTSYSIHRQSSGILCIYVLTTMSEADLPITVPPTAAPSSKRKPRKRRRGPRKHGQKKQAGDSSSEDDSSSDSDAGKKDVKKPVVKRAKSASCESISRNSCG